MRACRPRERGGSHGDILWQTRMEILYYGNTTNLYKHMKYGEKQKYAAKETKKGGWKSVRQTQTPVSETEVTVRVQRGKEYPGFLYSAESYASVMTHVMSLS